MGKRSIEYLKDHDLVLVKTYGVYVLGSEKETLKNALDKARENNCKRLLFDHREATVIVKTMEAYNRPFVYKDIGFDRSIKLASLLNEISSDLLFYENVCLNRGWPMRVFDNYDSAIAWLME